MPRSLKTDYGSKRRIMRNFDTPMSATGGASAGGGASPKTGELEVALAVQKTSAMVTLDLSQTPFGTTPPGLFGLAFNDNSVGISADQMEFFKARLKELLPEIADTIDGIPAEPSQIIGDVARIVWLALRSVPAAPKETP
jgi:hypothetical protein